MLRSKIAQAIFDMAYPRPTLDDAVQVIVDGLRQISRTPEEAERRIGKLYGHIFKTKEREYDAQGGRWNAVSNSR